MPIKQPDGTVCYTGVLCKRHGQFNKVLAMVKDYDEAVKIFKPMPLSIYEKFKSTIRERNWQTFPYISDSRTLPLVVQKRIENWAIRNNVNYEFAEELATRDEDGWQFVVHPEIRRQSWQEEALFTHLKKFPDMFSELAILPKSKTSTHDSLTLKNGILIKNKKRVEADDGSALKTLDGYVKLRSTGRICYIIAKYTEGVGGSQDNQANEALRSLKQQKEGNDFLVAAILDGDYYQKQTGKKTWIEQKQAGLPENSFIGSHEDFLRGIKAGVIF